MNAVTQLNKIVNSNRWTNFMESTAKGLQINLSLLLFDYELIEAPSVCPVCLTPSTSLKNSDIHKARELTQTGAGKFITEEGDPAITLTIEGGLTLVVRDCPACTENCNLTLENRAQVAQKLLNSFYIALIEGFQGGRRAIEISTLRHMNHITLSLFQGKEDAAERSFDLILSALIIILDAQGSWLELSGPPTTQLISKGDRQAITDYLDSAPDSSDLWVTLSNNGIKGRLGVYAPADSQQAKELLPLMAEEVTIVMEVNNLFKLFHKRLIRILDAIDSGIVLVDKNGILSYVNRPFEQLLETPALELIGKSIVFIAGPWTPYIKAGTDQLIEGKVDVLNLTKKPVCVDWQVSPLIEEDTVQGWIIFVKDRTDYYRWQEEIRKAERLATTTTLVGSLAHELRNPLSAAQGLLQLTRQKGDSNSSGGYIDLIQQEIDRVTTLLSEFLLLGKPADKLEKPVSLASLLRELAPLLESEAYNYGSELLIDIQSDPYVKADPGQLTQVFMNLVRNGAQAAGKQGSIFISLQEKERKAFLTIKDTGSGISYHEKDKLFRPFFTTKERGTGLGLAIVQAIIHNHEGNILVENAPEGGAIFQIILPTHINLGSACLDVLMIVKDYLLKYPSEQAVREAGLSIITADNLPEGIELLEDCKPKIIVIENYLVRQEKDFIFFKQHTKDAKIVILGETCFSKDLTDAIYIKTPLNYLHLVSQLKLICPD